jgi:hypothetical protein
VPFILLLIGSGTTGAQNLTQCNTQSGFVRQYCINAADNTTGTAIPQDVGLWAAVDVIAGISYGVWRLTTRDLPGTPRPQRGARPW